MKLTPEQNMALAAQQALLQAERDLAKNKTKLKGDALKAAKEALRLQRQTYREHYRTDAMALEQAGVVVTPDSIKVPSG